MKIVIRSEVPSASVEKKKTGQGQGDEVGIIEPPYVKFLRSLI